MAAPKPIVEEEPDEAWLITYADAITLLMAFFVMLLTFAKYDIPAFEEAAAAIKSNLTGREATSPIQLLRIDVQDVVFNMQADQVVKVETDGKGVVIELSSSAFYKPGSADFRDEAIPVLEKLSATLQAPRYQTYVVEVEGHTDDIPINTATFPSNWELSAARATRVVRFFQTQEMEPGRMLATGYADNRPKAPNLDPQGNPVPENRAKNRRVSVRVYPMSVAMKDAFLQQMADNKRLMEIQAAGEKAPEAKQEEKSEEKQEMKQDGDAQPQQPVQPAQPAQQ